MTERPNFQTRSWRWWRRYKADRFFTGIWVGLLTWAVYSAFHVTEDGLWIVLLLMMPIAMKLQWHVERDRG
jgi:hypothetical protein